MSEFAAAAVIGAGVMGAGIAAQLADAGLSVTLLDQSEEIARGGVERQVRAGGARDPDRAKAIRTGGFPQDVALLAEADWIIEAAAEQLEVKRAIFNAVAPIRKPRAIVSSNTSTIPLARLVSGLDPAFARNLLITHFFNPPIKMRLLEVVEGPATEPGAVDRIESFASTRLNKVVVRCADTPGFVANRIGNYWATAALEAAETFGLDVETADAVLRVPFGSPVGVFAFLDVVGIDLVPVALRSLQAELPTDDPLQAFSGERPLITAMIRSGRTGRKAGAGFMRKAADGDIEVLDLATLEYRPRRTPAASPLEPTRAELRAILAQDSPTGRFAWSAMSRTLAYAASLTPSVVPTPEMVDTAMREGYGWRLGPFELIDAIGADWLAQRLQRHQAVPPAILAMAAAEDR